MADLLNKDINSETKKKNKAFFDKITSDMSYKAKMNGDAINFDWIDIVEQSCPYLDNVVRNPKLILVNEAEVELIEKAKKITVESIKDLAVHNYYIDDVTKNGDVRPSKILNIKSEETYNIYENRFLYTVIYFLNRFLQKKEKELDELLIDRTRKLEYIGTTRVANEEVKMQVLLKATDVSKPDLNKDLLDEIASIRKRMNRVKDYISSWYRSELFKQLEKARVKLVNPPIKKTNIILKNPNFKMAVELWNFLYNYVENEGSKRKGLDSDGSELLMGLLDHAFLVDFYVLESVCKTKKEQKEKLNHYALSLINDEIRRLLDLLKKCGFKITDDEILELIANNLGNDNHNMEDKSKIANQDIKNKFKSAMDDYLERVQEYL